jgi:Ser/Thr protein kinase RdoA (MazF antagonist)
MGEPGSASWPTDDELLAWWPGFGTISERRDQGSGLRLVTPLGAVHVRRRRTDRVDGEVFVLANLAGAGLPVTVPLLDEAGRSWRAWSGDAVWAYRELPGSFLALDGPDGIADGRRVGAACAVLGRALSEIPVTRARRRGVPLRPGQRECAGLPTQVIHRDFHAGNVLFSEGVVTGYLDFDHLEVGPRVLDLCYAASSLLALMMSRAGPDPWLSHWHSLVEGYSAEVDLTDLERSRTAELMIANQHDFVSWFEFLGDVENVALTHRMIRYVEAHADDVVALAR